MKKLLLLGFVLLLIAGCSSDPDKTPETIIGPQGEQGESGISSANLRMIYEGTLDGNGNAIVAVPEMTLNDMPMTCGYIYNDFGIDGLNWYTQGIILGEGTIKIIIN